jgi:polyether ionophore transport system permease protein
MTAHAVTARTRPSTLSRIYGFGTIYAKTIRDSRLAFIVAAGLLGGVTLAMGAAVSSVFPTPASRLEIDNLIGGMPAQMVDFFGKPEKLGTLGGYLTWKYGLTMVLITTLWSVLALSGTLAGEASRGSLDVVATAPFGKRRIALEKVAAHLTMLVLVLAIMVVSLTVTSNTFGDAALGDRIDLLSAVGFALWLGFGALFFGGLAFALAPVLGRAGSAGVAAIAAGVLWTAHTMDMGPLALLSPYRWMGNHVALVGEYDWTGLALVGIAAAVLLVIGLEVFARRDLGVTAGLGLPTLPGAVLGVSGPTSRAFGEQLPRALAWGIGLGVFGAMLASLVGGMSDQLSGDENLLKVLNTAFPGLDLTTAGGFLQLFIELFYIVAGFAAATFVSKWASDETGGRLEEVLATPLLRSRWVLAGGIAALAADGVMTLIFALSIGLGAGSGGVSAGDAMLGSVSLGLYAAALIGIGVAIGGLWRASVAAEVVALLVVATYLVGLLALPLGLPEPVHQLALTSHFGQPMAGQWDAAGVIACLVLAAGGLAIGSWGMRHRDVGH